MPNPVERLYIAARRIARRTLTQNPALDRMVGDLLRKVDNRVVGSTSAFDLTGGGTLDLDGIKLSYRASDHGVVSTLRLNGEYEPETTATLHGALQPGSIYVDLGAHIGYFALLAARRVGPTGHVYAFEPGAETRAMLEQNVAQNGFERIVTVVPQAIADRPKTVRFMTIADNSVSAHIADAPDSQGAVEVQATSLDAWFGALNFPPVTLIKMDVEGAEIPALEGMREVCRRSPGIRLIIEMNYPHLVRNGLTPDAFFGALRVCGFTHFHALKTGYNRATFEETAALAALAQRMTINILCTMEPAAR